MTVLTDLAVAATFLGTLLTLIGSIRTFQIVRSEANTRIAHSEQLALDRIARRAAEEQQRRDRSRVGV
jgi:hypothetical protein